MEKPKKLYRQIGIVVLLVLLALSSMGGEASSQERKVPYPNEAILEGVLSARMYAPVSPDAPSTASSPGSGPGSAPHPWMAYDSQRGVTVLPGVPGVWEYDGSEWRPISTTHSPSLVPAGMAYDQGRARTILAGLRDYYIEETWEYDGTDWTHVTAGPFLTYGAMAYDSSRQRTVLFGGMWCAKPGCVYYNETWEYDGHLWVQINTPHTPPPRAHLGLAYDADRQVTVLFGGYGGSPTHTTPLSDTWEYDGSDWHLITPTHSPSARSGHAMVYDAGRKVSVLFGGVGSNGYLNDTWEYDGSDWHLVTPTLSPAPRSDHALVYDAGRGVIVLFGGHDQVAGHYFADTWEYDGTTWRHVAGPMDVGSKRR